jgi:hypothetical protein
MGLICDMHHIAKQDYRDLTSFEHLYMLNLG